MMNREQILQLKAQSQNELAEARRLMKREPCNNTAKRINRDLSIIAIAEIELIDKILSVEDWVVLLVDSYWYKSGRNYDTYVEVTYWVNQSGDRKETKREETIISGNTSALPDWAKCINKHNRQLDNF